MKLKPLACFAALLALAASVHAEGECPPGMKQLALGKSLACVPGGEEVVAPVLDEAIKTRKSDDLKSDPKFLQYVEGVWSYPKRAKGEYCFAAFQSLTGVVSVTGPAGGYNGAMLNFYGPKIPKPPVPGKQLVTLTQSPDPAVTLHAFHHTHGQMGVISLPVPSIDAVLNSMMDVQPFKLEMGGALALEITWRDGLQARDQLRRCVRGK